MTLNRGYSYILNVQLYLNHDIFNMSVFVFYFIKSFFIQRHVSQFAKPTDGKGLSHFTSVDDVIDTNYVYYVFYTLSVIAATISYCKASDY